MKSLLQLAVVALVLLLHPMLVHASNGMENISNSTRNLSAGGAYIAVEPCADAISGNPAALGMLETATLYGDVRDFVPVLDYTGMLQATGRREHFVYPNLAYAQPAGQRWAWGLGVMSQAAMGYGYESFDLSLLGAPPGTRGAAGSKFRFLTISPALAYKLDKRTAVGLAYNWSSGVTDEQSYDFYADATGHGLSNLSGHGQSLRAGVFHQASSRTALGAYWRSRSHLRIENGTITYGPYSTTPNAVIEDVSVKGSEFPEQYGVGLAQQLDPSWKLLVEWRHLNWAEVKQQVLIEIPDSAPLVFPMDWKSQDVLILGTEFSPDTSGQRVWRAGLNYAASPVPDSTLNPLFPSITELHLTAGLEQQLNDELRLCAALAYGVPRSQSTSADNALNPAFGAGQPYSISSGSWEFGLGVIWQPGKQAGEVKEESQEAPPADCCVQVDESPTAQPADNALKTQVQPEPVQ